LAAKEKKEDKFFYKLGWVFLGLCTLDRYFSKTILIDGSWYYLIMSFTFLLFYHLLRGSRYKDLLLHRVIISLILLVLLHSVAITIPCEIALANSTGCDDRRCFKIDSFRGQHKFIVFDGENYKTLYLHNEPGFSTGVIKGWSVECCYVHCYLDIYVLKSNEFYGK
jgi:hypothetical protein